MLLPSYWYEWLMYQALTVKMQPLPRHHKVECSGRCSLALILVYGVSLLVALFKAARRMSRPIRFTRPP